MGFWGMWLLAEVSAVGSGSSCNFVAASSRMSRWFVHDEYAEAKIGGTSSFRPDEDLGGLGDDLMAQLDFAANGTGDSNEGEDEPLREQPPNHVQGENYTCIWLGVPMIPP
jgi:hypothetical protein